ncbi:TlpA disulfide reductase family protein [uncultured Algoriphagus sp.]|uniref:TlpA family protein disulfide reductase n=1 Tax=uncultured Algoriphagus sp. TaxID=417365 RepID=UPI0030EE9696|tara:strand:- start:36072 stop:36641 length:570 start_codon:yes stop_codon:yes gene_type:complete
MKKLSLIIFALLGSYTYSMSQTNNLSKPGGLEDIFTNARERTLGLPVGTEFPDFEYIDLNGNKLEYSDLKEKLIVLNTWFVGCKGCKEEEENLKKLTQEFKDRDDIVFLSFAMSSPQKIERYFSKWGDFGYKTASVDKKWVNEKLKINSSPTHYIIKDGILVEQITISLSHYLLADWYKNRILEFAPES